MNKRCRGVPGTASANLRQRSEGSFGLHRNAAMLAPAPKHFLTLDNVP